jgi:EmrB/QacA subfamily drug resistance transporter
VIDELTRRRRIGILLICSMSLLIVGLDITIVNVALPSIGRDFHASLSGLQWTVDAYTMVLASLLMLSGSTADRLGRRRTFVIGLLTFAVGSLLCSLAPNLATLIVFRMVQAVGGSMLNPVAMSIITNTFTVPRERAQAIGVWAAVVGVSMALGPVVGGLLVSSVGWRSIFWINIPVGLTAVVLALRYVPESKALVARRVDVPGQVLVIMLLVSLTYGIIEAPERGWSSAPIIGAFVVAAVSLAALLVCERRASEPLIDLRFFRSVPFSSAAVIAIAAFAALGGFLFLNTLYLQEARGLSPFHAGIDTLPMAVMTMLIPPFSGRMVGRRGSRIPLVIAGAALGTACLMLVGLSATTPFTWLFTAYATFGIGFGFVNAPITNAAVSGMPKAQAGVAAAIASTSRQIGQTLGVAVVGSLVSRSLGTAAHTDFALASRAGWWVLAGCGAVVLVLGLVASTPWARATARRTAESINPEFLEATQHDQGESPPRPRGPRGLAGDGGSGARQPAATGSQRSGRPELRKDQGAATDRGPAHAHGGARRPARRRSAQLDNRDRRP